VTGPTPTPATDQPDEPPIDVRRLRASLVDLGNMAVFRELLTVFLHDTPERVTALRRAAGTGDARTMRHVAHTLKGTCGYIGAHRLVRICRELEASVQGGDLTVAVALVSDLEAEYRRVHLALEQELKDTGP
jgi:HPt (histidine-containing phosphotransfer) domain-containing protein